MAEAEILEAKAGNAILTKAKRLKRNLCLFPPPAGYNPLSLP